MADISITLTLDDTQYTANLKKIDTNTQAFGTNTKKTMTESTNAVNMFTESLKKSSEQITGMGEKFKNINEGARSLVETLVGLSAIEFGKKLLENAENTVHLANAFGMTVEKTLELQAAFAKAGIDSDKAGQALSKMAQAVDMVRQGTPAAIASFDKLGISTQFLQANQNNLPAILQAISKSMSEGAVTTEKLAAVRTILGRAMSGKEIGEIAGSMDEYSGKMTGAAKTTQDLANIQKHLIESATNIKTAFLEIIGPVAAFFSNFTEKGDRSKEIARALADAILLIGSMAAIKAIGALVAGLENLFISLIGSKAATEMETLAINANIVALANDATVRSAGITARIESLRLTQANAQATMAELAATLESTRGNLEYAAAKRISLNASVSLAAAEARLAEMTAQVAAASKIASGSIETMTVATKGFMATLAVAGTWISRLLGWLGLIVTAALLVRDAISIMFKFDIFDWVLEKIKNIYNSIREILNLRVEKPFTGNMDDQNSRRQKQEEDAKRREEGKKFLDQQAAAALSIRQQIDTMKLTNDLAAARVALELNLVGATNETKAAAERAFTFQSDKAREVLRIRQEIARMETQAANEDAGKIKYGSQLTALRQQLAYVLGQKDAVGDLAAQLAKAKDEQERSLFYLKESADVTKNVALIHQQIKELTMTTQEKMEAAYVKPMEEAIKKATDLEEKIKGSKLTDDEILAVNIKIRSEYERQIQAQKDLAVAQHSFGTGFQDAFNKFVDSATDAATIGKDVFNTMANSMTSAIDSFVTSGTFSFADFARSVIFDLEKILIKAALVQSLQTGMSAMGISTSSLGAMGSSLGALFGFGSATSGATAAGGSVMDAGIGGGGLVFAAAGGDVGYGQMAIVGEQGPELIRGPASVSNASQTASLMSGGGDTHIHNYNIQAVDAKSVAQLFYENRQTMFGMTEQARRELPMRVRS